MPNVSKLIRSLALIDAAILRCKGRPEEGNRSFLKHCALLGILDDGQNPETNNAKCKMPSSESSE
jgi:hypothetical protein